MLFERRRIPLAPLLLGLGGLIPFWGLALILVVGKGHDFPWLPRGSTPSGSDQLALALAAYGAIIVSFLGGIRWGFAVREGDGGLQYALSVVPSLLAWAALAAPSPWRLALLGALAIATGPADRALVRAGIAPAWFGRLRMILSLGAGAALLVGALGVSTLLPAR